MCFNVAIGTKLIIQLESDGIRFTSILVGYFKEDCILITTPSSNNLFSARPTLFIGCKINVRYLQEGSAVGFQATLLRSVEEPVRLLFLSFPKYIEDRELRVEKRWFCMLPTEIQTVGLVSNGVITDITQHGLRFQVRDTQFTAHNGSSFIGEECNLRFFLPGDVTQIAVLGEIRNYEHNNNHHLTVGVKFTNIADEDRQRITDFESKLDI
jgi:hypothetical protein